MRGSRAAAFAVALSAVMLVGAACSSKDEGGGGSSSGASDATVTVKDFAFEPSTISVSSGEHTITVTNTGSVEHSFTLDDDSASVDVEPGDSKTVTVNATATIGFHCEYHPEQMKGTLEVS
jgi:plastocyanin